jgi:folate-binding protein YgfZ
MTDNAIDNSYAFLPNRSILSVSGPDARQFLQGLISNDMRKVSPERAIWAALLTPQGKFLHDFFITERAVDGAFLLEVETHRREDLTKRLKLYRLRAKVDLGNESPHLVVAAIFGDPLTWPRLTETGAATAFGAGTIYRDPRLSAAGLRLVAPAQDVAALGDKGYREVSADGYDQWRLGLGLPDGSRDLVLEKATLMESGFDELHGIDWSKGCYIGQELTARMKYRGLG